MSRFSNAGQSELIVKCSSAVLTVVFVLVLMANFVTFLNTSVKKVTDAVEQAMSYNFV